MSAYNVFGSQMLTFRWRVQVGSVPCSELQRGPVSGPTQAPPAPSRGHQGDRPSLKLQLYTVLPRGECPSPVYDEIWQTGNNFVFFLLQLSLPKLRHRFLRGWEQNICTPNPSSDPFCASALLCNDSFLHQASSGPFQAVQAGLHSIINLYGAVTLCCTI